MQVAILNACNTQTQAIDLVKQGIATVVSTNQKVGDETAARFTQEFYKNLFSGRTYKDAFDDAIAIISAKQKEKVSKQRGAFDLGECPESDTEYVLLTKEAGTDELSFANLVNDPYFGLPELPKVLKEKLTSIDIPYLSLQPYTEREAPLFFGRGWGTACFTSASG